MKQLPGRLGADASSRATPEAAAEALLQIKVWLSEISLMIRRRALVPASFGLRKLHGVIQVAMAWEGIRLFQFRLRAGRFDSSELSAASPGVTPAAPGLRKGTRSGYEYDLNIPWRPRTNSHVTSRHLRQRPGGLAMASVGRWSMRGMLLPTKLKRDYSGSRLIDLQRVLREAAAPPWAAAGGGSPQFGKEEEMGANKFVLKGAGVEVDYTIGATPGLPALRYKDGAFVKEFTSAQIKSDDTGLGELTSVPLIVTIDTGGQRFGFFIPSIDVPRDTTAHFRSVGIYETFSGPDSIPHRPSTWRCFEMSGTAQSVIVPV